MGSSDPSIYNFFFHIYKFQKNSKTILDFVIDISYKQEKSQCEILFIVGYSATQK
jgi:hypothetical protein